MKLTKEGLDTMQAMALTLEELSNDFDDVIEDKRIRKSIEDCLPH